ncbi:MAG: hypothetical protein HOH19_01740 [Kordiimonadaceae bacterium]|jgi:sugar (pentulose or hexulose) kinase|nr:hypothetical protein [Kordiimonadaceae bacterium]MBT6031271.1 hypothetical protein [Kordiimonadaceae bacterium]
MTVLKSNECTLVIDVGKTNVKLILLDNVGRKLETTRKENKVLQTSLYPCIDMEGNWQWFVEETHLLSSKHDIGTISISTHGACAALVDLEAEKLVLPILDYEFNDYPDDNYAEIRQPFNECYSPNLPGGLNIGRQLHYQLGFLSDEDQARTSVLFYPSYWAWRLSGVAVTEMTSIGCHTDLWDLNRNQYSSVVGKLGLTGKFPPIVKAWEVIGTIRPEVAADTGLKQTCRVMPGVHDSNAGYIPYLDIPFDKRPTVISTGTWTIAMSPHSNLDCLDETRDMLANIDASGGALATARYMGGREYAEICNLGEGDCTENDIENTLSEGVMALPSFGNGSGPFGNIKGKILGELTNARAVATIYSALMIDHLLSSLNCKDDIIIEGRFATNDIICSLLAAIRNDQKIRINSDVGGIAEGCFRLAHWDRVPSTISLPKVKPYSSEHLVPYVEKWKKQVSNL